VEQWGNLASYLVEEGLVARLALYNYAITFVSTIMYEMVARVGNSFLHDQQDSS
jgi:hypothetical protein